jgi:hypothetical protein
MVDQGFAVVNHIFRIPCECEDLTKFLLIAIQITVEIRETWSVSGVEYI